MVKIMKHKHIGIVYLFGSIFYVIAEFISAIFFHDSLIDTYLFHTISELGIPNINSPLSILMNCGFILIGLTILCGNFIELKNHIVKNKNLFYIFSIIASLGVIIVGLIHGGNPLTSGYHTLGAVMAILGGNLLLLIISKSMNEFKKFQKVTCILGLIGLISFWIMFFNMTIIVMPVFERLSVYPLIIWSFLTGLFLLKTDS